MNIAIILVTLSLILCVISFVYLRWYINRKTSAAMFLADYRTEVEKLIAEIDTATDRDSLLVEERMKTLRNVLADADRRIAVYMRELERRQVAVATQSNLASQAAPAAKPSQATQPTPATQPPPQHQAAGLYTNLGHSGGLRILHVSEPEPTVATANISDNAIADNAGSANHIGEKKELRVQIAELAATGLTPAEIASQLEVSRSEVDLALSMAMLKRGAG